MNVSFLRSAGCDSACELLVVETSVSPLNTYSVLVAYVAPLPVDDATEYHLNG